MVMENRDVLTLIPVEHPDPRVQRFGFDLTDPYVERPSLERYAGPPPADLGPYVTFCGT